MSHKTDVEPAWIRTRAFGCRLPDYNAGADQFKVGDDVVIHSSQVPGLAGSMARVCTVFPGTDGFEVIIKNGGDPSIDDGHRFFARWVPWHSRPHQRCLSE